MDELDDFELQYADELELMDDIEPVASTSNQVFPSTPASSLNMTPFHPASEDNVESPLLSQINRQLQDGSFRNNARRYASTPFPGASSSKSNQQGGRKRRLEEIFGDIQDIDDEPIVLDIEQIQKKTKSEEERDLELIDTIVNARKRLCSQTLKPKSNDLERLENLRSFKMQNLSYAVPKWPYIKLYRSDQERIFVRFHSEEFEINQLDQIGNHMLAENANKLLGDRREVVWQEAKEINKKRFSPIQSTENDILELNLNEGGLWVEKYKARKYVDLLSDESCNRSLLKWIKLWDKVVFNREVRKVDVSDPKIQRQLNTFNKKTGRFEQNGGWMKRNRFNLNEELDETDRPVQKIALLCGPPGLGKTTLGLTIARHAGYQVVEVNASDDRSPEAFRQVLENGTQMQSVFSDSRRPNCIVLDEIDGAPSASIDFLLRFAAGTAGKKAKKNIGLKRPIICICNDPYVASLRQLRQQAFVIHVPSTDSSKLVDRLQHITRRQNVQADLSTLFALAEKTGNDIRSCLSLLQFLSAKKKQISLLDVIKTNIGQKDQQKEMFKIWTTVFQVQRPSKALIAQTEETSGAVQTTLTPELRWSYVLRVINMSSDYDKLMQGVFENYLHQKMPDPNFNGISEATEWFSFNDRLQTAINHSQNYSVYGYLPFSFVAWHFLFATLAWPKINFPNKNYEVTQKQLTSKNMLTLLRKNLDVSKRGVGDSPKIMLIDSLPLVKVILCPNLRSVSIHLLSQKEKTEVKDTVDIIADLGLSFIQLRTSDGTYSYQLEPDLDALTNFYDNSSIGLSYWAKQLLSREVELEKMRRIQSKTKGTQNGGKTTKTPVKAKRNFNPNNNENVPNFLRTLQPVALKAKPIKEVTRKDFFGRITTKIIEPGKSTMSGKNTDNIVKGKIWYCYKEGFNNAVRKSVTIADLV